MLQNCSALERSAPWKKVPINLQQICGYLQTVTLGFLALILSKSNLLSLQGIKKEHSCRVSISLFSCVFWSITSERGDGKTNIWGGEGPPLQKLI